MSGSPERILFFTDYPTYAPSVMLHALVSAVSERDDFELAGVCTPDPRIQRPAWRGHLRERFRSAVVGRLDPSQRRDRVPRRPLDAAALARRGIPVLAPPDGDVNDPRFVDMLAKDVRPTLAFVCYCRILRPALLDVFDQTANYHDGWLPRYRGNLCTSWSLYNGDADSGFSFHRMTPEVDAGPVLIDGGVPVAPDDTLQRVVWRKIAAAAARVPQLLDLLARRDPGRHQQGEPRSFRRRDADAMSHVDDPTRLDSGELWRRQRAFGRVWLRFGGEWHEVTRLEPSQRGGPLSFRAADGVVLRATRFGGLPLWARRLRGQDERYSPAAGG